LGIEIVFSEDTWIAGDLDDQLTGADAAIANGYFEALSRCHTG